MEKSKHTLQVSISHLGIDEIEHFRKTSHRYFSDPPSERTDESKRVRSAAKALVGRPPPQSGFGRTLSPAHKERCVSVLDSLHIFWSIFSACLSFFAGGRYSKQTACRTAA